MKAILNWIDLDWLNRIGIILNFFAGFLLAPDLIGRNKLLRYEQIIEKKLNNCITTIRDKLSIITGKHSKVTKAINDSSLVSYNNPINPFFVIILLIFKWILLFFLLKIGDLFICIYFWIKTVLDIVEILLSTENTLISILTFVGIIFFIVGNLFQLIATFK